MSDYIRADALDVIYGCTTAPRSRGEPCRAGRSVPTGSSSIGTEKYTPLVDATTVDDLEIDRALARQAEEHARHAEREIEDVREAERQIVRDAIDGRLTPTPWTTMAGFVAIMTDPQYREGGR